MQGITLCLWWSWLTQTWFTVSWCPMRALVVLCDLLLPPTHSATSICMWLHVVILTWITPDTNPPCLPSLLSPPPPTTTEGVLQALQAESAVPAVPEPAPAHHLRGRRLQRGSQLWTWHCQRASSGLGRPWRTVAQSTLTVRPTAWTF